MARGVAEAKGEGVGARSWTPSNIPVTQSRPARANKYAGAVNRAQRNQEQTPSSSIACKRPSWENETWRESGATVGFGNTAAGLKQKIDAKYAAAKKPGHGCIVKPCILEVFGGFDSELVALLHDWAARARQRAPEDGGDPPWWARNFVPYHSQLISQAAQRGAAAEILSRARQEESARQAWRSRAG